MKSPLLTALALSTANILGPLAVFGGLGWYLTKITGSNYYLLGGVFVSFVLTNILIFTTTTKVFKPKKDV